MSHHSFSDLMLSAVHQHDATVEKMPATCRYLTPSSSLPSPPYGLCVTSAPAQARISLLLSGVTKGYIPHFTAYMPYWNAKCCLIFVLFWRSIKKKKNLALPFFFYMPGLRGGGAGFEKAICSPKVWPLFMLLLLFLDHRTIMKNCMHTNRKNEQ